MYVTHHPYVLLILRQKPVFMYLSFSVRCETFRSTFCFENWMDFIGNFPTFIYMNDITDYF